MDKFKNKYRIASTRLPHWDYGSNALYFVTICCKNRQHFFGNVANQQMQLSQIGQMAEKYWLEITQHFPFVILHQNVIMPNHVHGIIEIAKSNDDIANGIGNGIGNLETQNFASLPPPQTPPHPTSSQLSSPKNQFGPQSKNLSSIIRGFKIGVTKNARKIQPEFGWQPRFHDHIIRNQASYSRISNYILTNPARWNEDKFYTNQNTH